MNQLYYNKILNQLCCEKCCDYCFIKEVLLSIKPSVDVLMQIKCIEKFKWEESERLNYDIGWNKAGMMWVDKGYASKFRSKYKEGIDFQELYTLIINDE